MATKSNNQFEKINALRSTVKDMVAASGTLNQAVKALAGLEKKYAEACEALGVDSLGLKSVIGAWSSDLRVEGADGRMNLALYVNTIVTVPTGEVDEEGNPICKNAYERVEGKNGSIKFKALKVRTIVAPEKWTPSLIIEGLVQSMELEQAKLEAEVARMHANNQIRKGVFVKVTENNTEDGSQSIRFEAVKA